MKHPALSLFAFGLAAMLAGGAALAQPVTVTVDLSHKIGPYKPIYAWFGYDEANFTTGRDGKKLLRELHDLSPVPVMVRAHHLLTSGDGTPELKWSSTNVYREDAAGIRHRRAPTADAIFAHGRCVVCKVAVQCGPAHEAVLGDQLCIKSRTRGTLSARVRSTQGRARTLCVRFVADGGDAVSSTSSLDSTGMPRA